MRINANKTKELNICFTKSPPIQQPLTIDNVPLYCVQSTKILGISIQSNLKWDLHVATICRKASKRLYALRCLKRSGVLPSVTFVLFSAVLFDPSSNMRVLCGTPYCLMPFLTNSNKYRNKLQRSCFLACPTESDSLI